MIFIGCGSKFEEIYERVMLRLEKLDSDLRLRWKIDGLSKVLAAVMMRSRV